MKINEARLRTTYADRHFHSFEVSPGGEGVTTIDAQHRHDIVNFQVQPANDGHTHRLVGVPDEILKGRGSVTPRAFLPNRDVPTSNPSIFSSIYEGFGPPAPRTPYLTKRDQEITDWIIPYKDVKIP